MSLSIDIPRASQNGRGKCDRSLLTCLGCLVFSRAANLPRTRIEPEHIPASDNPCHSHSRLLFYHQDSQIHSLRSNSLLQQKVYRTDLYLWFKFKSRNGAGYHPGHPYRLLRRYQGNEDGNLPSLNQANLPPPSHPRVAIWIHPQSIGKWRRLGKLSNTITSLMNILKVGFILCPLPRCWNRLALPSRI
jgi:hypothetical protein